MTAAPHPLGTAAPLPLGTAAVIGLGTVGSALARALARAGAAVIAVEPTAQLLTEARARTLEGLDDPSAQIRISFSTHLDAIAGADFVLEAVPERFELKTELLRRADQLCGPDTVFATTTARSVTQVAAAGGRLPRTVGLHPVGHAPAGGAIEVVTTPVTEPAVRAFAEQLVTALGRTPIVGCDRPGFIGLGLLMTYLNGAIGLYERRYASREDIDAAMTLGCGLPLGPLAQLDLIGLDTVLDTLTGLHELTGEARFLPPPLLEHMVTAGLLGVKSGRGFHHYPAATATGSTAPGTAPGGTAVVPRPVRRVGIIGSGTMATGIAEVFARSGFDTVLVARTEVRAKTALDRVAASLERGTKRGKITAEAARDALERLTGAEDFAAVADCDLVVEAVAEELPVKREVFRRLDQVCRPGALLSTTTSSLPVVECAAVTSRPESVLGLHFFNPAPVMRLVEVVGTVLTADDALATAHQLCARLGKHPVTISDRAGFIVNTLLFPYLNAAVRLLEEHRATPEQIDTLITAGCGYPMGPLTLLDAIGLDVSLQIQHSLHTAFRDPALAPARPLEQLVGVGHLGRKTGRGFHSY
ncbi:3-hydroxyacyl-CoA dehydrogenase NAD-binding domain-containing protein [Kitasatospora sp. NBC_01287]|uniref:3-hydroxyacyl-CoA dehydrogenase family protein n=1 Tax=Kitasatospora sp. NBC_01287 TaxID=2903573 RepID=UPI0022553921|nr:3-hydroxyacyl-CoA dehydrogenase [Kitasatospora sp. NBC_01287]MCX4750280.1 3-hydroxyacyl-CoA dehydrogenase NAD-binding domain-containing protein [Kitasatospora sp. NBC_01287]